MVDLRANAPKSLAGEPVVRTDALTTNDGFKFFTPDGSWLLIRFSGTEPLVRVMVEARDRAQAQACAQRIADCLTT